MFTGIIEEVGRVEELAPGPDSWKLRIGASIIPAGLALGDSVAVNGCCLTVTRFDAENLCFDVLEETRRLTNFGDLNSGARVNLERSLLPTTRMGGHFVTGHVDALGVIEIFEQRGKDSYFEIGIPADFGRFVVAKGSVALDGISLTIAQTSATSFGVWLIPHTLEVTNLRDKIVGSKINVEFDLLAKHLEKLLSARDL